MEITPQVLMSAPNFVIFWIHVKKYTLGNIKANPAILSDLRQSYDMFYLSYTTSQGGVRIRRLTAMQLEDALTLYIQEQEKLLRKEAVASHKFNASANPHAVNVFIRAITGRQSPIDIAALSHWLWQVKRRSQGDKSVFELMPIFVGKQGGGKSMATRALLKSWTGYVLNIKVNELSDSRMYESYSKNFIAFADELEGADRTDMNALKNQITTEFNSYRIMYSTNVVTEPMTCSFIGASNRRINEVFFDYTGMRRFYEIICQDKLDWTTLNSMNYLELWQSIDESRERGYLTEEVRHLLEAVQDTYVNKNPVELFLLENAIHAIDDNFVDETLPNLFNAYKDWCANTGNSCGTRDRFKRMLDAAKLSSYDTIMNGAPVRMYKINRDSTLAPKVFVPKSSGILEFKK